MQRWASVEREQVKQVQQVQRFSRKVSGGCLVLLEKRVVDFRCPPKSSHARQGSASLLVPLCIHTSDQYGAETCILLHASTFILSTDLTSSTTSASSTPSPFLTLLLHGSCTVTLVRPKNVLHYCRVGPGSAAAAKTCRHSSLSEPVPSREPVHPPLCCHRGWMGELLPSPPRASRTTTWS